METLLTTVTLNRLNGATCPEDLRILLTDGIDLLNSLGVKVSGDVIWEPWADKSYLTAEDLADPDIAANVRAIDDTFAHINFVAQTDDDVCIGYWRGPNRTPIESSPLVSYDTEGQFRLCGGRFVEALFFEIGDDDFREACRKIGIDLPFKSLDDIVIPATDPDPRTFHLGRYHAHKGA